MKRVLGLSMIVGLLGCGDEPCPKGSVRGLDGVCHLVDDDAAPTDTADPGPTHGLTVTLDADLVAHLQTLSPMPALPANPSNRVADDPAAAALGALLFDETRFSRTGNLSCASCHQPDNVYCDGERVAFGEELYPRNTNSLVNVAYYTWVLWDGGCDALWCQAWKPLENRHEMNGNRMAVAHLLANDPELRQAYTAAFGAPPDLSDPTRFPEAARPDHLDPEGDLNQAWEAMDEADQETVNIVLANWSKALEAFQRTLVSTHSPFDDFIEGLSTGDVHQLSALSPEAQRGLVLFFGDAGCTECHDGPLLASDQFVNVGLDTRPWLLYEDNGRFEALEDLLTDDFVASGPYSDDPAWGAAKTDGLVRTDDMQAAFRVPSLRNVSRTGPYMHGGHFDTIAEVLNHYNTLDEVTFEGTRDDRFAPLGFTDTQLAELEAFLVSLALDPVDLGPAE
jgi:cytochrome c peroxidase